MKDQVTGNPGKFIDPDWTADGAQRAQVSLTDPQTLWFNTGTLCNITCAGCYIESSPTNDALVYLTAAEVDDYLDQLDERAWGVREIGFTGGEPFMNPQMIEITGAALSRDYDVLILTNAMRPMMRPRIQAGLESLHKQYPGRLTLRVSLDHHSPAVHDAERGKGSFSISIKGMEWLCETGIKMAVAGRIAMASNEAEARAGYGALFAQHYFDIDPNDPAMTILFPEMDTRVEVPEITTACWDILGKSPQSVMCASSRMVIKRKGAASPTIVACTLLPYDPQFDLGQTLSQAESPVRLNHPHCAKFCVLGGASCTG